MATPLVKNDTFKTFRETVNQIIGEVAEVTGNTPELVNDQAGAPSATDNSYKLGDLWLDVDTIPRLYILVGGAGGAAQWNLIYSGDAQERRDLLDAYSKGEVDALVQAAIDAQIDGSVFINDASFYDFSNWALSGNTTFTSDNRGVVLFATNDTATYTQDITAYVGQNVDFSYSTLILNNPAGASQNEAILVEVFDGPTLISTVSSNVPGQNPVPVIVNESVSRVIADGNITINVTKTSGQNDVDVIMSASGFSIEFEGTNYNKEQVDSLISLQPIQVIDLDSNLGPNFSASTFNKTGTLDLIADTHHNKETVIEWTNPQDGGGIDVQTVNVFLEKAENVPSGTFYKLRLNKKTNDALDFTKKLRIVPNADTITTGFIGTNDARAYDDEGIVSDLEFQRMQLYYDGAYLKLVARNNRWHLVEFNEAVPIDNEFFGDEKTSNGPNGSSFHAVAAGNTSWRTIPHQYTSHWYELDERSSGLATAPEFLMNDIKRIEVHLNATVFVEESGGFGAPLFVSGTSANSLELIEFGYNFSFDNFGGEFALDGSPIGVSPAKAVYIDGRGLMNISIHLFDIDPRDISTDDMLVGIKWRNTGVHTGAMEVTFTNYDVSFEIIRQHA